MRQSLPPRAGAQQEAPPGKPAATRRQRHSHPGLRLRSPPVPESSGNTPQREWRFECPEAAHR